jgi:predicted ester cyclase
MRSSFFERRQVAYDNLDAAAIAADYAPDCVVNSPTGGTHHGPAAVEQVLQAFFNGFLNSKIRVEGQLVDGNQVAQILHIEGTHIGEFLGLSRTGKPFRLSMVLECELRGCQIVRERRIYDFTGLLMQIGVLRGEARVTVAQRRMGRTS